MSPQERVRATLNDQRDLDGEQVESALFEADEQDAPQVDTVGIWKWSRDDGESVGDENRPKSKSAVSPLGWMKKEEPVDPFLDSAKEEGTDAADVPANEERPLHSPSARRSPAENSTAGRRRLLEYRPSDATTGTAKVAELPAPKTRRVRPEAAASPTIKQVEARRTGMSQAELQQPETQQSEKRTARSDAELRALFEDDTATELTVTSPSVAAEEGTPSSATATKPNVAETSETKSVAVKTAEALPAETNSAEKQLDVSSKTRVADIPAKTSTVSTVEFEGPSPARIAARERRKMLLKQGALPVNPLQPEVRKEVAKIDAVSQQAVEKEVTAKEAVQKEVVQKAVAPEKVAKDLAEPSVRTEIVAQTVVAKDEPAARAKVDLPAKKPEATVELPLIRPARATSKTIAKAPARIRPSLLEVAPDSPPKVAAVSSPVIKPVIKRLNKPETSPVDQGQPTAVPESLPIIITQKTSSPPRPLPVRALANRSLQIAPPQGWSAATKQIPSADPSSVMPRQLPLQGLENTLAMPPRSDAERLEFPQSASRDQQNGPTNQQFVTLGSIEDDSDIQVTRALNDVPSELNAAVFVEEQSSTTAAAAPAAESTSEPIVVPELAKLNHSPWLQWMFIAFGTGFGLCFAWSRFFRRNEAA